MAGRSFQRFPTTRWSVLTLVRAGSETVRRAALESLFSSYWYPMYAFVRNRGYSPEDSRDLVQQFFVKLLENDLLTTADREKGRFRAYIRTALARFLKDERVKAEAQKRGGAWAGCDLPEAERRYALQMTDNFTPEHAYERDWAYAVLEHALESLRAEYAKKEELFARLRQFLPGGRAEESYGECAAAIGMTETALKVRVHRMRQRFGQLVREEVAQTLSAEEVDDEIRHLLAVLTEPARARQGP